MLTDTECNLIEKANPNGKICLHPHQSLAEKGYVGFEFVATYVWCLMCLWSRALHIPGVVLAYTCNMYIAHNISMLSDARCQHWATPMLNATRDQGANPIPALKHCSVRCPRQNKDSSDTLLSPSIQESPAHAVIPKWVQHQPGQGGGI